MLVGVAVAGTGVAVGARLGNDWVGVGSSVGVGILVEVVGVGNGLGLRDGDGAS